jgi:tetratricopeptide (TPR) repeat protein
MVKKNCDLNLEAKDWYEKGKRLTSAGCHKEAIEAFTAAIHKNSEYAEAYFVRGACHYVTGNYRQAMEDLDAAALLGCQDAQFWSKYGKHATENSGDDNVY